MNYWNFLINKYAIALLLFLSPVISSATIAHGPGMFGDEFLVLFLIALVVVILIILSPFLCHLCIKSDKSGFVFFAWILFSIDVFAFIISLLSGSLFSIIIGILCFLTFYSIRLALKSKKLNKFNENKS